MDITTRIIAQRKVNTDTKTGLDRYSQVTSLNIDGENNGLITVKGRIVLLSSTGVCMLVESQWSFTRYDKAATTQDVPVVDTPATYYEAGETITPAIMDGETEITPAVLAVGGELKTAEVSHTENQVVTPENNKYTQLEQSPIGQGIKQMLGLDLDGAIVNEVWISANLNQL
jgi:hypothetical protein